MRSDLRVAPIGVWNEAGALIFSGQRLAAVLTHLTEDFYDEQGRWYLGAASGPLGAGGPGKTFGPIADALDWIGSQEELT